MRRTPLVRKTPLRSRTALTGSVPGARSSRLTRVAMARKRPARSREEAEARRLVAARSGGRCEGCARAEATDWAHRVARSQGGLWAPENGLHLCHSDHMWSHANPVEARSVGWILRSTDNPLTFPALLAGRGHVLLTPAGGYQPIEGSAA